MSTEQSGRWCGWSTARQVVRTEHSQAGGEDSAQSGRWCGRITARQVVGTEHSQAGDEDGHEQ